MNKQLKNKEEIYNQNFTNDLQKYFSTIEVEKILNNLIKNAAYREKEILKNYSSMKLKGVILEIYSQNGNGFGIDARKNVCTLGEIVL